MRTRDGDLTTKHVVLSNEGEKLVFSYFNEYICLDKMLRLWNLLNRLILF